MAAAAASTRIRVRERFGSVVRDYEDHPENGVVESSSRMLLQDDGVSSDIKTSDDARRTTIVPTTDIVFRGRGRAVPLSTLGAAWRQVLRRAFLPEGFPDSVSKDYTRYQVADSLQALCSGASGFLAAQAVLAGAGVGDAAAIPLAAALQWALRDGAGMVGRILFAWRVGAVLDARAKQWRLAADILNDAAMALDLVSGSSQLRGFFGGYTGVICLGALLRSVVGVAGPATRAAVTQHQARADNSADVSAKDGAQETFVSLAGMLLGIALAPIIQRGGALAVWLLFSLFTFLHILANWFAVRALVLDSVNVDRCRMLVCAYVAEAGGIASVKSSLPGPSAINAAESVFLGLGTLRAWIGSSDRDAVSQRRVGSRPIVLGGSVRDAGESEVMRELAKFYKQSANSALSYIIVEAPHKTVVLFFEHAQRQDVLRAFVHVCCRRLGVESAQPDSDLPVTEIVDAFIRNLGRAGWNVDRHALCAGEWRLSLSEKEA